MTRTIEGALKDAQGLVAPVDARALLRQVLACDDAHLLAHADDALTAEQLAAFRALASRRAGGEPVAYLTGEREFFSLAFKVTPAVLIPRPETELLVELALARIPADAACRVLDVATGSGCVAVALASHRPLAHVVATETSAEALVLARENAQRHALSNVGFVRSNWLDALSGACFDLIVANPPYVAAGDPHLGEGDVRYEPRRALVAGRDGLDCIRAIVSRAPAHLTAGGWLLFEHGHDQARRCRGLLAQAAFENVFSQRDLTGIERVSGGRRVAR